ncbi:hypothetical protein XENOCAPTIV_029463 [Xenoophorus captivus]|uniref:Uncharacterized protein n=1 Tax=Xenoophorus captivus TaxID=1517983 RepID=A0ABV0RVR6_9TELE
MEPLSLASWFGSVRVPAGWGPDRVAICSPVMEMAVFKCGTSPLRWTQPTKVKRGRKMAQEPIPESQATYGAVRPYRESPLLARALTKADMSQESPQQPPDSPIPGGDVRRKVQPQSEEGDGVGSGGDGVKADVAVRKRGVLEGAFLGRKRAPPIPSLSSGSEGGGSDSSANASPSPTKLSSSTSPRHRKPAAEPSSHDSSL